MQEVHKTFVKQFIGNNNDDNDNQTRRTGKETNDDGVDVLRNGIGGMKLTKNNE